MRVRRHARAGLWDHRAGVASLEFAAAGTTVMVVLLAALQLATLFVAKRGLDHGVNRAARWSAVNSTGLTPASVLAQFKTAAGALLPDAASCLGYAAGASIPGSTTCAVTVTIPSGTVVGSVVTVQATYKWTPAGSITGLVATTLQSTTSLTVQY